MRRFFCIAMIAALAGCGTEKLETGYVPHKLGANDATRRSFYAAPFAPEAKLQGGPDVNQMMPDHDHPRGY